MKHQALFSLKDKSKKNAQKTKIIIIIIVPSAAILLVSLRVNRKQRRTINLVYCLLILYAFLTN